MYRITDKIKTRLNLNESTINKLIITVITMIFPVAYIAANPIFKTEIIYDKVNISNITLNLILLYGLWGLISDKISKKRWNNKKDKWKGWTLTIIGCVIMGMFFKYVGGYETIFG